MKNKILNLGSILKKGEQKAIHGGIGGLNPPPQCPNGAWLEPFDQQTCTSLGIYIWYNGRCWSCKP